MALADPNISTLKIGKTVRFDFIAAFTPACHGNLSAV
jgi:hypothetical protein